MFYLLLILIIALCNTTLFFKGYSYIGYAVVISVLVGLILFRENHSNIRFSILSCVFLLSLLNVATEVFYKMGIFPIFNPVKYDQIFYVSTIYLTISIISGMLWHRKQKK